MGVYLPLFSVEIAHEYFATGRCRGLDFVPTPQTAMAIQKTALLTRSTDYGISVFYDQARSDSLHLYATDPEAPFNLSFKVFSIDSLFDNYTEPALHQESAMLYFDNRDAVEDTDATYRLHAENQVSETNFKALDSPVLLDILSRKDKLIKPMFVVNICISEESGNLSDEPPRFIAKRYVVRFKAKDTHWKYYLLGDFAKEGVYISDPNQEIEFEPIGEESLSDNRVALTFRSNTAIPLREKSDCRFQLRASSPGSGKVLIRRLPVASASQINRDVIDGETVVVSEMFVNC